jgi:hypothetical protein
MVSRCDAGRLPAPRTPRPCLAALPHAAAPWPRPAGTPATCPPGHLLPPAVWALESFVLIFTVVIRKMNKARYFLR